MQKNETIVIKLSKAKLFLLLVIALIFFFGGLKMFNTDSSSIESERAKMHYSPFYVHSVGAASLLMGILGGFVILKKIFESAPGLIISRSGIIENSNIFSIGEILWEDISGFKTVIIRNQKILYVLLKDPEIYLSRCNPLKRKLLRFSLKISPSPVAISISSLQIDFEKMVSMLEVGFEKYQQSR